MSLATTRMRFPTSIALRATCGLPLAGLLATKACADDTNSNQNHIKTSLTRKLRERERVLILFREKQRKEMAKRQNKRRGDQQQSPKKGEEAGAEQQQQQQPAAAAAPAPPKSRTIALKKKGKKKNSQTLITTLSRYFVKTCNALHPVAYYSFVPLVIIVGMRTEPRPAFRDLFSLT